MPGALKQRGAFDMLVDVDVRFDVGCDLMRSMVKIVGRLHKVMHERLRVDESYCRFCLR